jgi:hypothetical protein
MSTISSILDHYFEPVTTMFTREMAEALVNRKPDEQVAARVAELGHKADEGTLTDEELDEYKTLVDAGDLVALLKTRARQYLDEHPG